MLWVDLAIALVPVVFLAGVCVDVWGDLRRLIREVGAVRETGEALAARSRR